MIKEYVSEKYGKILYEESLWTGRKRITVNGIVLTKDTKNTFSGMINDESVKATVVGNVFKGCNFFIGDELYNVSKPTTWYEYVIGLLPFILIIIWGNSVALCSIVPVIGGAIGGAISAVASFFSVILMKRIENIFLKILIGIGMIAITFIVCMLLGFAFVSLLS